MNKSILIQYADMLEEIEKLEKRIDKIKMQSEMASDVVQNGYKRHAVIYGVDITRKSKLRKLHKLLDIRYSTLLELQTQVEEFIQAIPNSKTRQIFEHRYIEKLKWFEIAHIMDFNNEDAPRKRHDRFLEKI